MSSGPAISVLFSAYNDEKFIHEGLEAILAQTFGDFELLVLDDCSTDRTGEIAQSYADPRIVYVRHEKNMGLPLSLNRGFQLARGQYFARMDADDICVPDRFARQYALMEENREITVCGGWMDLFGASDRRVEYPADHARLKSRILFTTPFSHPFVMFRGAFVRDNGVRYSSRMRYAEDYELWLRLAHDAPGCCFANIQDVLGFYRIHGKNISLTHAEWQRSVAVAASWTYTKRLAGEGFADGERLHAKLCGESKAESLEELARNRAWLLHLKARNEEKGIYDPESFDQVLGGKYLDLCKNSLHLGGGVLDELRKYPGMERNAL